MTRESSATLARVISVKQLSGNEIAMIWKRVRVEEVELVKEILFGKNCYEGKKRESPKLGVPVFFKDERDSTLFKY